MQSQFQSAPLNGDLNKVSFSLTGTDVTQIGSSAAGFFPLLPALGPGLYYEIDTVIGNVQQQNGSFGTGTGNVTLGYLFGGVTLNTIVTPFLSTTMTGGVGTSAVSVLKQNANGAAGGNPFGQGLNSPVGLFLSTGANYTIASGSPGMTITIYYRIFSAS